MTSANIEAAGLERMLADFTAPFAALAEWETWIRDKQCAAAAIAAPTHGEGLRAEWMLRQFQELGLLAGLDGVGNVIAVGDGANPAAPGLALTAHLDTAFAPGTETRPVFRDGRLWGPGISDNAAGLAALLALARALGEFGLATAVPVYFIANVGEEGEGDLKGMRHIFADPEWRRRLAWTVVIDGPGGDQVTTQALASRRFKLVFEGPGGHSWSDAGRASAVHAASRAAAALLEQVRPQPGLAACNIGGMLGGSAINAIAAQAALKIDLRATTTEELDRLQLAVRRAAAAGVERENAAALSGAVRVHLEALGERPAGTLSPDSRLLRTLLAVDATLGIVSQWQCASTDANIPLSLGREALRLGAGGAGGGIHTLQEWFSPEGRDGALRRILLLVLALAGARPSSLPICR